MSDPRIATAYAVCRGIARREARNFYYSFLALPRAKCNALSAVYAFMRHADDISDDETSPPAERKLRLESWLEQWRRVSSGTPSDDPVFVALADAQKRYQIPGGLLDQLVQGTSMDLESAPDEISNAESAQGGTAVATPVIRVLRTFSDLYRYCYLVASVVGLVCIRIYGYDDPRAEELAERCGVAFQLTNIIRDVKEDASMGRVYFPEEDLVRFGLTPDQLLQDGGKRIDALRLRSLLEFEAARAREYYQSATALIPLIHKDSRAALWVMVTIYKRLLEKIADKKFDVLHRRVRLSAVEKCAILGRGLLKSVLPVHLKFSRR
ncbi:MAG TPA: phytoene/squalene synthase family protein [Terriglobales bacterium]|nr:phytoene/squalene synthase family protein [Terriglobales bacterium]